MALVNQNLTNSDYNRAVRLSGDANFDKATLEAIPFNLQTELSAVDNRLAGSEAVLDSLKNTLETQYQFLRRLSPVAVDELSKSRGVKAARDFDDTSSLISQIRVWTDQYLITDTPGVESSINEFLPGESGNSIIRHTVQEDFFEVLSLTGLNTYGIHADHRRLRRPER